MSEGPEFPHAEPRKRIVITFDDEPQPDPAAPPAPVPSPAPGALWSAQVNPPRPAPPARVSPSPAAVSSPPAPAAWPAPPPAAAPAWPSPAPAPQPAAWAATAARGQLSGWWRRFFATLVDGLIGVAVVLAVTALVGAGVGASSSGDADTATIAAFFAAMFTYLVVEILWWLLYAPFTMMRGGEHNGQTLGKQLLGIRVVRQDGQPVTAGTAILRDVVMKQFLLWGLGSFLFCLPGIIDGLWPLGDPQRQSWHDKSVSTVVVLA